MTRSDEPDERMGGTPHSEAHSEARSTPQGPLAAWVRYFLRLGAIGFGGPIVLSETMRRDLVVERRWVSEQDFKEGFAFSQLAPGPLAAQLAMYLGWVRARSLGATLVGTAFVGPSLLMVLALAAAYVRYSGLPWMRGAFYGIGAAVIAVIARSAVKLVRSTVGRDRLLWLLFAASAVVTARTESEIVWLFVASGLIALLVKTRPHPHPRLPTATARAVAPIPVWVISGLAGPASLALLWKVLWYFTGAALFVFGSGLAIVPFLHGGVVQRFHWLTERQFLDAVAVSMITPGPVVITVAFIGYLTAGLAGGLLAALGIFLPVYVLVVVVAPSYRRLATNRRVRAFVDGVTAAASGAIAGAAVVLGRRAITDLPTIAIFVAALALLTFIRKLPEPVLMAAAGIAGFAATSGRTP